MKQSVMDIVMQNFRPEFLNRVDESVVFHPLDADNIKHIANIQFQLLRKRLHEKEFDIELSDEAL